MPTKCGLTDYGSRRGCVVANENKTRSVKKVSASKDIRKDEERSLGGTAVLLSGFGRTKLLPSGKIMRLQNFSGYSTAYPLLVSKLTRDHSLQGKPASGKSTLMKYLRDNLQQKIQSETGPRVIIADFFYNHQGGPCGRGHIWMLRSILYQILRQVPDLWVFYSTGFKQHVESLEEQWSFNSLQRIFTDLKSSRRRDLNIYIFIDAMDESDDGILQKDIENQLYEI